VIAMLAATPALAWLARSPGAGTVRVPTDQVPMRVGDWKGRDLGSLDRTSQTMLQPDAAIVRLYRDRVGREAELTVVYGHKKTAFHSPGECLLGGGWNIIAKQRARLALRGRPVVVNRFLIQKENRRAVVIYAYAQGERVTPSWVKHQLYLAGDRARGGLAMGALVRVILPVQGSEAATDEAGLRFMATALPSVIRSLEAASNSERT
jgi:EpsI family protein